MLNLVFFNSVVDPAYQRSFNVFINRDRRFKDSVHSYNFSRLPDIQLRL